MAPTNWDYDRDFVYHSSTGNVGDTGGRGSDSDRNWADRLENSARRGWDRIVHRGPRSDYDRDFGFRSSRMGYDRDLGSRDQWGTQVRYDRDLGTRRGLFGATGNAGYAGTSRGLRGYGADYARDFSSVYDRAYKSRMETEMGDPFNDRGARTPIRIMRGEYRGYGRDFSSNPMSYEPNEFRTSSGYRDRGQVPPAPYDRDFRGLDRGYDRGWF